MDYGWRDGASQGTSQSERCHSWAPILCLGKGQSPAPTVNTTLSHMPFFGPAQQLCYLA